MSQAPSQNSQMPPADTVQWPSLGSYWGAFKRQFLVAVIFSIPVAFLVLLGLSLWPREYSSTSQILYDPNQTRGEITESSGVLSNRMASTFTARFLDPEFMARLAKRLEEKGMAPPEVSEAPFKKNLAPILPPNLQPGSWSMSPEELQSKMQIEQLLDAIKAETVPAQFQLSIVAKAAKPEEAQLFAREAMNLFIEEELGKQKEKMQLQIAQLSSLEGSLLREKNSPADIGKTEAVIEAKGGASAAEKKELKTREQGMINFILNKQAELARAQSNQIDRQFTLESELNNLQSRKGALHPEVAQKRSEIEKFKSDPAVSRMEGELALLKQRLNELQVQMRRKGVPVDRSVQVSGFSDEVRRYLTDVSNQIRNLELEIRNIDDQIKDPGKRRRFTSLRDPELPRQPSDKKKFLAGAGVGFVLVLATFFLVIIVREVFSPLVHDQDTFKSRYPLPVVAEVKSSWQKRHTVLTSDRIRALRSKLSQLGERRNPELQLLDGYRYLQQYILRHDPVPQVICVLDLTADGPRYSMAGNLANVMATDNSDRVFLLSFRPKGHVELKGAGQSDLMDFLAGKVEWKTCRIKPSDSFAFEAAIAQSPEDDLQSFRSDMVQKLIKALREKYQRVIIEGFGPGFIQENGLLAQVADAVVIQVGLGSTKKTDLDRLLQVEDPSKVRAVILRS